MKARILIAAAAILLPATAHAADCRLDRTDVQPDVVTSSYDPFSATIPSRPFHVDVATTACPANRTLFLVIDAPDPAHSDGRTINLIGGGGAMLSATLSERDGDRGGGSEDVFEVKAGLITLYLRLAPGQRVPPGLYRAAMRATSRLNHGTTSVDIGEPFQIVVRVEPAVGLAPANGGELDLAELTTGDRAAQDISFDAYANVDYELRLTSDHGFALKRNGSATGFGVDYVPLLDGSPLSTAAPRAAFDRPPSSDSRTRHRLNVSVPTISGAPAGRYEDYLTIEIQARVSG